MSVPLQAGPFPDRWLKDLIDRPPEGYRQLIEIPDDYVRFVDKELTPITKSDLTKYVTTASFDLTLGPEILVPNDHRVPYIDPVEKTEISYDKIDLRNGPAYVRQGTFFLGSTQESVNIPDFTLGWFDGKSSLGRSGLITHHTASGVAPGFSGNIVTEMTTAHPIQTRLRMGMEIGQLYLFGMAAKPEVPYNERKNAKYSEQKGTVAAKAETTSS